MKPSPLGTFITEVENLVGKIPPDEIPGLLGDVERIRAMLWARLATPRNPPATDGVSQADRLLDVNQAAEILNTTSRWLYRHANKLPFTRRLSRKNLKFSELGLHKWIAKRKP